MTRTTLTFAIATDGPIREWQARTIEALERVEGASIERWDRRPPPIPLIAGDQGVGALAVVDVPESLRAVQDAPAPRVDIVLDLTNGRDEAVIDGETWYFVYGRPGIRDAARAAQADYVRGRTTSRVTLRVRPGGHALRDGRLVWHRADHLERLLLDVAGWPADIAIERLEGAADESGRQLVPADDAAIGEQEPVLEDDRGHLPSVLLELAAIGRRLWNMPQAITKYDDWNVGIIRAPIQTVVAGAVSQPIAWFPLRPGRFVADPFGIDRPGGLHVFVEDYDQREGRGTIAYVDVDDDGGVAEPEIVLDTGGHASYPFLIEEMGSVFMLPETSSDREVALYEATRFPRGWHKAATLVADLRVVDATVVRYDGRWWMFGTNAALGPNHNLYIWHAPALTGPWTAHAANPVKTDARSARPGGTPFIVDEVLYRPSQDCSRAYGGGLVVNRVDLLTPRRFSETPIAAFGPPPGSPHRDGFHTLSSTGGSTLVDGKDRHLVAAALQRTVAHRVGPLARRVGAGSVRP